MFVKKWKEHVALAGSLREGCGSARRRPPAGLAGGHRDPEKPSSAHSPTKGLASIRVSLRNKTAFPRGFSTSSYLSERKAFLSKIGLETGWNVCSVFASLAHFPEPLLCQQPLCCSPDVPASLYAVDRAHGACILEHSARVPTLPLPLTSCAALSNFLSLSVPLSPHL